MGIGEIGKGTLLRWGNELGFWGQGMVRKD